VTIAAIIVIAVVFGFMFAHLWEVMNSHR